MREKEKKEKYVEICHLSFEALAKNGWCGATMRSVEIS